ncbi:DNA polymerase alpha/epsilon subunit B-domain-containing protein [Powellomyces hirtus]|nr:DNA polymerase alpha/epsilon subunit B-domain-containing protein [Powellomyces hirtus]
MNYDNDRFTVKERVYTQQYAGIYFCRLNMLRPKAFAAANERWGKTEAAPPAVPRVLDVKTSQVCYIVGTVYVDMPLKPCILDEVTKEHWILAPPPREKYATEDDEFILEDESGRVSLTGSILKKTMLVTGIIIAVLGCETASGQFEVIDICYPALKPQIPPQIEIEADKYVAVVSGLNVGDESYGLDLELLIDFLTGELGTGKDQHRNAGIVRVIVAGNSVTKPPPVDDEKRPARNRYGAETATFNVEPIRALDTLLAELCETLPVDLLPGEFDPANFSLPQQPIHYSIFPSACKFSSFNPVTNPCKLDIDGISLLATSGQTLDNIFRYVATDNRLSMAEKTIVWGHLAPTAPDTLWCHPFKDTDPFVLSSRPHIYIVGNQPKFETSLMTDTQQNQTRVVLVPSFAVSKTIVLINLRTLEASPVVFNTKAL